MSRKFNAFTLAEVLITLAIIGIVAALTIPNLIHSYKKKVVETKLLKFYTVMNEAIRRSEIDNGDKKNWNFPTNQWADSKEEFYNKYFNNYIKSDKRIKDEDEYNVYFTDGSAMLIRHRATDYIYCIDAKYLKEHEKYTASKCFRFGFYPTGTDPDIEYSHKNYLDKGLEPYVSNLHYVADGDSLTAECVKDDNDECVYLEEKDLYTNKLYATKIIQLNNWKIPDDYPWKL